jgi:hypothetical protein
MARTKKATAKVEEVRPYVEGVAKNLVDKLYGPAGLPWGVPLTEREDVCLGVRAVLTEKMLEAALERQAADHPRRPSEFGACPGCHRPLDRDDVEARLVQTRAGQAEWLEPQAYCRGCRQAFSPSVPKPVALIAVPTARPCQARLCTRASPTRRWMG